MEQLNYHMYAFEYDQQLAKTTPEEHYNAGMEALKSSNKASMAFNRFALAAEAGHKLALLQLGLLYDSGKGVKLNHEKALDCFKKVLTPEALFKKGKEKLKSDDTLLQAVSFHYFKAAAEKDYIPAQFQLGLLYELGKGVRQDYQKALDCYKQVIDKEGMDQKYLISIDRAYYRTGIIQHSCVLGYVFKPSSCGAFADSTKRPELEHQNHFNAYQNFLRASESNKKEVKSWALYAIGWMHKNNDVEFEFGGKKILNPDLAGAYFEEAAELGLNEAMYEFALILEKGNAMFKQNTTKANSLFKDSADLGHAEAALKFAQITTEIDLVIHYCELAQQEKKIAKDRVAYVYYKVGQRLTDPEEARRLYKRAADLGHSTSMCLLGEYYIQKDTERNRAASYLMSAAGQSNILAIPGLLLVGDQFKNEGNATAAFTYIKAAADLGSPEAQLETGMRYRYGDGTKACRYIAERYFHPAILGKETKAKASYEIGLIYISFEKKSLGLDMIREAAKEGLAEAQHYLGDYYRKESASFTGTKNDFNEALTYYKEAARLKYPAAYKALAEMYRDGYGIFSQIEPDYSKAIDNFKLAAEVGAIDQKSATDEITKILKKGSIKMPTSPANTINHPMTPSETSANFL